MLVHVAEYAKVSLSPTLLKVGDLPFRSAQTFLLSLQISLCILQQSLAVTLKFLLLGDSGQSLLPLFTFPDNWRVWVPAAGQSCCHARAQMYSCPASSGSSSSKTALGNTCGSEE